MDLFHNALKATEVTPKEALLTGHLERVVECPVCYLQSKLPDNSYHHWTCRACKSDLEASAL